MIDSLGLRSALKFVAREEFAGFSAKGGDIEAEVGTYYLNRGRKVYECKNHLGNVLAVVSDVKLGISTSAVVDYYIGDVVEMTDYEPFGMQLANRHWVSGDRYRFAFNGKEHDDEWNGEGNMLDFGARVYDSRLGRWLARDPLEEKYPSMSTYSSFADCPTSIIDVDGRDIYLFDSNDKLVLIVKLKGVDIGYRLEGVVNEVIGMARVIDPSHLAMSEGERSEWQSGFVSMFGTLPTRPSMAMIGHDAYGIGLSMTGIAGGGYDVGIEAVYFPHDDQFGFYYFYGPGLGGMLGAGAYGLVADKEDPQNGRGVETWKGYFHSYSASIFILSGSYFWSLQDEGEDDYWNILTEWDPTPENISWGGKTLGLGAGSDFGLSKTHTWYVLSGKTEGKIEQEELDCLINQNEGSKVVNESGKVENCGSFAY